MEMSEKVKPSALKPGAPMKNFLYFSEKNNPTTIFVLSQKNQANQNFLYILEQTNFLSLFERTNH